MVKKTKKKSKPKADEEELDLEEMEEVLSKIDKGEI